MLTLPSAALVNAKLAVVVWIAVTPAGTAVVPMAGRAGKVVSEYTGP
jgi:hypothetical protein